MSEIDELISEQSLKNWNQFVASLDKAVTGLDKVIKNAADLDSVLGKLGISTKDVKNGQEAVNKAEKEAAKIQKQLQNSEEDKAAIVEKVQGIFSIGIDTAKGVGKREILINRNHNRQNPARPDKRY